MRPASRRRYACRPDLEVRIFMPPPVRLGGAPRGLLPLHPDVHGDASVDDAFCAAWARRSATARRRLTGWATWRRSQRRRCCSRVRAGFVSRPSPPSLLRRGGLLVAGAPEVRGPPVAQREAGRVVGHARRDYLLSPRYAGRGDLAALRLPRRRAARRALSRGEGDGVSARQEAGARFGAPGWEDGSEEDGHKWVLARDVRHAFAGDSMREKDKEAEEAEGRQKFCDELYADTCRRLRDKARMYEVHE
ncbi:hypothetical protein DL769_000717 [Monosporascus sp. CRB-8-3]|nr:hypothetical protein DL769_000717 [Monosporascus sp. CRB-8-3]